MLLSCGCGKFLQSVPKEEGKKEVTQNNNPSQSPAPSSSPSPKCVKKREIIMKRVLIVYYYA
ncbi:MAG: hypothetical protein LE169_04345 [Endomicrobium sp.]|nr:hypothetical protein [Endomicrobium sp.]